MSTSSGESRGRCVLVIANETVASASVAEEVGYRARGGATVVVVAPALARSRLAHWLSSGEEGQEQAEHRLAESLASLRAAGLDATGYLGDADPLQALDDALRLHGPDEVIISTHPPQRSNWLERQVVRRAREQYSVPITHIVVDVELEGSRTEEDARLQPEEQELPERRLRLFHRSSYDGALDIREHGFHDEPAPGGGGAGVLVSDRVGDDSPRGDAVLFQVELPEEAAAHFEREPGEDGARRFVVPAELLNRHGPVAVGDWSE